MIKEKYHRANEISLMQGNLDRLYNAVNMPHPKMLTKDNDTVCFIGLGEKYEKELKDLIINFIKEKNEKLDREFKEL